jgi:hypothetical protein
LLLPLSLSPKLHETFQFNILPFVFHQPIVRKVDFKTINGEEHASKHKQGKGLGHSCGAAPPNRMALRVMTLSMTIFGIMILSIEILRITTLRITKLGIIDAHDNDTQNDSA